jgi:hypothetical protein
VFLLAWTHRSPELYSCMPKGLNRSATTVSRLQHSVTATDLEDSESGKEEQNEKDRARLTPVHSAHTSSAHASAANASTVFCSAAPPCTTSGELSMSRFDSGEGAATSAAGASALAGLFQRAADWAPR